MAFGPDRKPPPHRPDRSDLTRPRSLPPTVAAGDESRPFRDRDETSGRAGAPPQFDARRLIGPGGAVEIILDNKVYTLRITKQRKLLLTK